MVAKDPVGSNRAALLHPLRELYVAGKEDLGRMLRFYIRDIHAVEDLVQQSFVEMHRVMGPSATLPQNPRAYLFQIARNLSMDYLQRRKMVSMEALSQDAFCAKSPATTVDAEPLRQAMNCLTAPEREVIALKVYEDFTFADIALITGMPPGTVHSHYRRGIESVRRLVGSRHR